MAAINEIEKRIPETGNFYVKDSDVQAYVRASGNGLFKRIHSHFSNSILSEFGKQPLRVLDIGTGPGWVPLLLAKARPSWNISAVDISPMMLQAAKVNASNAGLSGQIDWRLGRAESTGFPAESFDLIITQFAFHELNNPIEFLREIHRLLKKNGTAIIHDFQRPPTIAMPLCKVGLRLYYSDSESMRAQAMESLDASYSRKQMEKILKESGLAYSLSSAFTGGVLMMKARIEHQHRSFRFFRP